MFCELIEKVLIGLSGGVDSSVAAAVLKQNGYDVLGATLKMHGGLKNSEKDILDAKSVCENLNIEHYVFDFSCAFKREVEDYFINSYLNGYTPNPCIVCNKTVKFKALIEKADEMGVDYIATGHYSKMGKSGDRVLLYRPEDKSKDQTYVLYSLTQEQLRRTKMPLSDYTKAQIREIAEELKLINANRPDSQDICFIPDGDYAAFIKNNCDCEIEQGNYTDINGNVIGRHKGVIHYTIGQRKGLGIALGKPAFVISKNVDTNTVVIGDEEHLFSTKVKLKDLNFIPFDALNGELKVTAKLRYRHKEAPATLRMISEDTAELEFSEPQRAPAPGQAAVFYDGDIVIGGGIII